MAGKQAGDASILLQNRAVPNQQGVHSFYSAPTNQTGSVTTTHLPQKQIAIPQIAVESLERVQRDSVSSDGEEEKDMSASGGQLLELFLSGTSDSGDEHISEIVITEVYHDPLEKSMEAIEDLATHILRTGKLRIQGEPGDMSKLQPLIFGLQAMEREIPRLLPQLMQAPFFNPVENDLFSSWGYSFNLGPEDFLSNAYIRLGLPIDTAIYHLLHSHCCKGAKQAEELINTANSTTYNSYYDKLTTPLARVPQMPPIIFSVSLGRKCPPVCFTPPIKGKMERESPENGRKNGLLFEGNGDSPTMKAGKSDHGTTVMTTDTGSSTETIVAQAKRSDGNDGKDSGVSCSDLSIKDGEFLRKPTLPAFGNSSSSSLSTCYSTTEPAERTSLASILSVSTSASSIHCPIPEEESPSHTKADDSSSYQSTIHEEEPHTKADDSTAYQSTIHEEEPHTKRNGSTTSVSDQTSPPPQVPTHRKSRRKTGASARRPLQHMLSSGSEFSGEEGDFLFQERRRRLLSENTKWNTSIIDNSTIVGMYGDNTYPLLMWNPNLKVEFKMSSSVGIVSGMVTGIDPSKPAVTMKVVNGSPQRIAFSIRAYRQSSMFSMRVVYPAEGLHVLEEYQCWKENAEFYSQAPEKNEYFIIDLFICTLGESKPSWNVIRKYAVMKATKKDLVARRPSRRPSHFQMPGNLDQKEDNLQQVISHGLQCVVKGKLEQAETIFTHALYLPDFQRLPLKAFVYICLAVLANKRNKQKQISSLLPVMMHESSASQLVRVCETLPGIVKMPRTIQLVKQLSKELNIHDLMKSQRHRRPKSGKPFVKAEEKSSDEDGFIGTQGGTLSVNGTTVTIPAGAITPDSKVVLTKPDRRQLDTALQSTGWAKTVRVLTALHIQCNPSSEDFEKPIEISCLLPEAPKTGPFSLVRLQQSNYLRQWRDITDDPQSKVSLSGQQVNITTDRMGWLAVALVQLDPAAITQMAMQSSLLAEPITLQLSIYGQMFPDDVIQIAVFVVPCKSNEEPTQQDIPSPPNYSPIAFSHTIQAWPGERIQLELQGRLEPDVTAGETDLRYEFEVQMLNRICEKWVKLTSKTAPLSGKLVVRSQKRGQWERVTEINLSSRTGHTSSSSSDNP